MPCNESEPCPNCAFFHGMHLFLHFEFVGLHLKLEVDLAHASVQLVYLGEEVLLATRCLFNFLLQVKHDH